MSKNTYNQNLMPLRLIDGDESLKFTYSSGEPMEGCTSPRKMRTATVEVVCCGARRNMESTFILSVSEDRDTSCAYSMIVCHAPVCAYKDSLPDAEFIETVGVQRLSIPIARNGKPPGLSLDAAEIIHDANTGETKRSSRRSRASSKTESAQHQHRQLYPQQRQNARISTPSLQEVSDEEQIELKERVRSMFIRNYDAYMKHAYPKVKLVCQYQAIWS
jgi:hypothetical protein